jgi:NAD(P)-dependent dehydrogenase (short-subunit alcohol dehydrogenase family)
MIDKRIAVIGASGGIGKALVHHYAREPQNQVVSLSRSSFTSANKNVESVTIDLNDQHSIAKAADATHQFGKLDSIIIASGLLHSDGVDPEKSIKHINQDAFSRVFQANVIGPAVVARYFIPLLNRKDTSHFSALSARVGSISDNRLGGWYAYRASKAALNMVIKNLAIECSRTMPKVIVSGLHPGTTDTKLSAPFQKNVAEGKLFTPEFVAERLAHVLDTLKSEDSGKIFAWDGSEIFP